MKGVIIKQNDFGEGHRMLSVFTDEYGIVKAADYGARRTKSRTGASGQFLCFADFQMYRGGDIWTIREICPIDSFLPIQEDIEKLALCTYLADITYGFLEQHNPDTEILRLFLNTLHACAYWEVPLTQLKAVYELRLMAFSGYMPAMDSCVCCGGQTDEMYFDFAGGGILCGGCRFVNHNEKQSLPRGVVQAIRYICTCDLKRLFSFRISPEGEELLETAAERYLLTHIDKHIKSLDYLKKLTGK